MAIRVVSSEKSHKRNKPSVAVSARLKRLTLNKYAYELLCNKYGEKAEWAQLLLDDDVPGVFWVKPAPKEVDDCKQLDKPSPNTRSLTISALLTELNWSIEETTRYDFSWDEDLKAGRVDTNKKIDGNKGIKD